MSTMPINKLLTKKAKGSQKFAEVFNKYYKMVNIYKYLSKRYDSSEEAEETIIRLIFQNFEKELQNISETNSPSKKLVNNWIYFCIQICKFDRYHVQIEEMNKNLFFKAENQKKEGHIHAIDLGSLSLTHHTTSRICHSAGSLFSSTQTIDRL